MTTSLLKFKSLADLGSFTKAVPLNGYIINTTALTILAEFNALTKTIAMEEFRAMESAVSAVAQDEMISA
jgi:hypothetical protein